MIAYLLKSGACLALFFLFYKWFLERERMHLFNRFYLIAILALSFTIPLITFTKYEAIPEVYSSAIELLINGEETKNLYYYLPYILGIVYSLGVLVLSVRFIKNLYSIYIRIQRNPKKTENKVINVLMAQDIIPHTFFKYIFFNKTKFEQDQIPKSVVLHEQAHANQKHSIDILCIELLQIVFWFNPLLYFINKSIKLNHEFLADESVINQGLDISNYQKILLAYSSSNYNHQLANAINYSSIKKRFTIMKTPTSKRAILVKSLLAFPLAGCLLLSFSSTEVINYIEPTEEVVQEKVSKKMIAEYNQLAKKYNKNPHGRILLKEVERMEYIYSLMSVSQRRVAEPFPSLPKPPKPQKAQKAPKTPKAAKAPKPPKPPKYVAIRIVEEEHEHAEEHEVEIVKEIVDAREEMKRLPPPPPAMPKDADYYINGKKVSYKKVQKLDSNLIKSVNVNKENGKRSTIHIQTH